MEIKGKVHCFFEQSGTFKREFIKLGIPAEDYDIQNNFGETDHTDDLFAAIEDAYDGKPSLFDNITPDDLIMAFFPCIEFSCVAQFWYSLDQKNIRTWEDNKDKFDYMLEKNNRRAYMFGLLYKMCGVAIMRKLRLVFENPWAMNTYLKQNVFLKEPSVIDTDRTRRGDYYTKPTAYWYFNCEPTSGVSFQKPKEVRKNIIHCKPSGKAGLCSEERSMISPDYARNFICDFILGKTQEIGQLSIFNAGAESSL
jgi:hypothetical protein